MSDIPKNVLKGFRYLEKEYPMFDCYYGMTDKFKQQATITVLPDDNSDTYNLYIGGNLYKSEISEKRIDNEIKNVGKLFAKHWKD